MLPSRPLTNPHTPLTFGHIMRAGVHFPSPHRSTVKAYAQNFNPQTFFESESPPLTNPHTHFPPLIYLRAGETDVSSRGAKNPWIHSIFRGARLAQKNWKSAKGNEALTQSTTCQMYINIYPWINVTEIFIHTHPDLRSPTGQSTNISSGNSRIHFIVISHENIDVNRWALSVHIAIVVCCVRAHRTFISSENSNENIHFSPVARPLLLDAGAGKLNKFIGVAILHNNKF